MASPKKGDICQLSPYRVGNIKKVVYHDAAMMRLLVDVLIEETGKIETFTVTLSDLAIQGWQQPTIH